MEPQYSSVNLLFSVKL